MVSNNAHSLQNVVVRHRRTSGRQRRKDSLEGRHGYASTHDDHVKAVHERSDRGEEAAQDSGPALSHGLPWGHEIWVGCIFLFDMLGGGLLGAFVFGFQRNRRGGILHYCGVCRLTVADLNV